MTFGIVINTFGGQLSPYTIDDVSVIIETPADPDCQRLQGLRRSSGTFVVLFVVLCRCVVAEFQGAYPALLKAIVYE